MGSDSEGQQPTLRAKGHTFWRAMNGRRAIDLVTETGIELDGGRCRWTVKAPGVARGLPVESASQDAQRFMGGVLNAMERASRMTTVRPVPKPQPPPEAPLPPSAPVPCPLCRGEEWPDFELCDGSGIVTQRQAEEWRELRER